MMEQVHDPEQNIPERYFLGQLTDDEAEAFEAHFFECPRCAEYVSEELTMMESGRDVARKMRPARQDNVVPMPIPPRRRWDWTSAAVAAALVVAVGSPLLLRNRPQPSVDSVVLTPIEFSQERSAAAPALSFPEGSVIILDVPIPPADYPRFDVTVRNQADEVVGKRHTREAGQSSEPVTLMPRELPAGIYNVVIEGVREDGSRSRIASKPFEVRGGSR